MKKLDFGADCINCILKRFLNAYPEDYSDEVKTQYTKELLKLLSEAGDNDSAPLLVSRIYDLQERVLGITKDYTEIKKHFNSLMLNKEGEMAEKIKNAKDPFKMAISLALTGNYIDFGAMDSVSEETLSDFIKNAGEDAVSEIEYVNLKKDIEKAERIVYLTDNCGEIVADKCLVKEIKKLNPKAYLCCIVRGAEVLNDATEVDATQVGLNLVAEVLPNGTKIPGTSIAHLSKEAKEKMDKADVIISKGQGNFETLAGANKNIYYIFLCKCDLFTKNFNVPKYTGMLKNELR